MSETFITFGSGHFSEELGELRGYYFLGSRKDIFGIRGSAWAFEYPVRDLEKHRKLYKIREALADELTPVGASKFLVSRTVRSVEPAEGVTLPKIFIWAVADNPTWILSYAMAEDGRGLASHVSSSLSFALGDIGFLDRLGPGTAKRKFFAEAYPDGYELVWLPMELMETEDWLEENYPTFKAAYESNLKGEALKDES